MFFHSELSHIDSNRVIVKISLWENEKCLGSTLAEAKTVEQAQEKGINIMKNRIESLGRQNRRLQHTEEILISKVQNNTASKIDKTDSDYNIIQSNDLSSDQNIKSNQSDPNDWTEELTKIDYEINRLNWSRDIENKFIKPINSYRKTKANVENILVIFIKQ